MARSPDYLRLATSATRTLAEAAFDCGRDAVLVVDVRAKHLPVVLANQAARSCLTSSGSVGLVDSSLYGFLGAAAASVIESATASLSEIRPAVTQPLTWRSAGDETAYSTELKLLDSSPNQRLVMFTFNPQVPMSMSGRRSSSCPWASSSSTGISRSPMPMPPPCARVV